MFPTTPELFNRLIVLEGCSAVSSILFISTASNAGSDRMKFSMGGLETVYPPGKRMSIQKVALEP
jgi:hypothetical protein